MKYDGDYDYVVQVAVEQGNSCGRDLKLAADRVSQSEQEVMMMLTIMIMIKVMNMREWL